MIRKLIASSILFLMFAITTGCGQQLPPEESCNFVTNSLNRRVSWYRMPIQFYVDDSLSNEQYDAVLKATEIWNSHFNGSVFQIIGRTGQLPEPELDGQGRVIPDGYNGIYMVKPELFSNSLARDEQGKTSLSFRSDFIYEADILLDASENFYIGDQTLSSSSGKVELISLLVHEMGHALGLDHIEGPGNPVMQSKLRYGEVRHDITAAELDSLACEY
ncbi:MAG: matrixin family metalloprotease [Bdellovibrionales bacterium]|nr:matrixin family metalloprotease [Bdellovibrionales bacterium]